MAQKLEAGGAKKRPVKAPTKEKTQRERFIEAARAAGVDETGKELQRLFNKVISPQPHRKGG